MTGKSQESLQGIHRSRPHHHWQQVPRPTLITIPRPPLTKLIWRKWKCFRGIAPASIANRNPFGGPIGKVLEAASAARTNSERRAWITKSDFVGQHQCKQTPSSPKTPILPSNWDARREAHAPVPVVRVHRAHSHTTSQNSEHSFTTSFFNHCRI